MELKIKAPLDPKFKPMSILVREYKANVAKSENQKIAVSVARNRGFISTTELTIFKDGTGHDEENCFVLERIIKTLLWIKGGYKITVAGSKPVYEHIAKCYLEENGARAFDRDFMASVYERPFEVEYLENVSDAPATNEASDAIGRHLDGCRIGFDGGGSDRKVSAVIDGESVFSEEVIWHPKEHADLEYQYAGILSAFREAASKMPRVDAIGVSSAGVFIDNRAMVSSLFNKVPRDVYGDRVKNVYLDAAKELSQELGYDIPIEVCNDGDVTALAGAMDLNDTDVLGIAMGTSEAGGYVDDKGNITGWLNELAFVPVDADKDAMVDEWSGDYGCGVKYFSQDGVIKLAPAAGIEFPEGLTLAEKLKHVQTLHAAGDPRTRGIYETIGVYFGYQIPYYALFYNIKYVLILGRVTSGEGGLILLEKAREVLKAEFPELAEKISLEIPDEKSRRLGQSVVAASLPDLG